MILAGDIGGTKTTLALYRREKTGPKPLRSATFKNADFANFHSILKTFLKETDSVRVACFGVAGPIQDGTCRMLNLPWSLSEKKTAKAFQIGRVHLINDLQATASGMLHLQPNDRVILNRGKVKSGNRVVLAVGTGLGEAILCEKGEEMIPMASEGGHSDFAPRNEMEIALLRFLAKKYDHVSYERILSGSGLLNLYAFLVESGYEEPRDMAKHRHKEGPEAIATLGLSETSPLCSRVLHLFASLLGAEAGNLALKAAAWGGVYIGGGIAPKIIKKLLDGTFMEAFIQKGRYAHLMKEIPVVVSMNPETALMGAAQYAFLNFP
jgi:glucokinase